MFFKNPAGGVIPNFPVTHSIVEVHRQVAELNGELKAAGCNIVQNCDAFLIEVPAGVDVQPILDKHAHMFKGPVHKKSAHLVIGSDDETAAV